MQTDTMTEVPQAESQAEPQATLQVEHQPAGEVATDVAAEKSAQDAKGNRGAKPLQTQPVNHVLEKLFELYPKLFGAHFLPLKLGVFHDLMARHPDDFKKDELKLAMGKHARSSRYLECVAAGLARHDLDGNAVEPVSPEHVHHAILEVFRRRQARSREDLRPRLRVLLKQAIEISGLGLDDYAALVRGQDEASNAMLDEAMAELKAEAAKREALMVTFTASGRTEAEFADMYGMDLKLVTSVLARVRHELAEKADVLT
ncbi:MAG: prop effector [Polaromonas sp.]|nr:prop effector [Polaromonas sp.]